MGIAHFEDAASREWEIGHIRGRWTFLGEAAGSRSVGVRRIQVPDGGWSTPAHEHGREEEIFYVLGGRGLSWHAGRVAEVGAGDCIVYPAGRGAHTLHGLEELDVLGFGPRHSDESVGFPRLGMSLVGRRAVESAPGAIDGAPFQFVREAELGPPELTEPGSRPSTIVAVADVDAEPFGRGRVAATRRNLARAAGSVTTGLKYCEVEPERWGTPLHCHSSEEELFVVLAGTGAVAIGEEETPVRAGTVVARPPGTGVAHAFRAGAQGLTFLAYGPREPGDLCFYPRSNKVSFRGLGVIARLERLDYWDGEE
ncbi:MAG TPA: cupin domain-containing protein [Solirubrobacteraceae bacterium]|nr:cupin domain-containing protein [Solirubrobacteraceae bacterium]